MNLKKEKGSMTVEAALIYPFLFLITFYLVRLTMYQYVAVQREAGALFDKVCGEEFLQTPELIRISEAAFDLFTE